MNCWMGLVRIALRVGVLVPILPLHQLSLGLLNCGSAILKLEMDLEGDGLLDGTCENSIACGSAGANTAMASTISGAPK